MQGEMTAVDRTEVHSRLRELGMTSISVRRALPDVLGTLRWWVTSREQAIVLLQLGTMLEVDVPLLQAVDVLASQSPRALARCLRRIHDELKMGRPIDRVLSLHLSIDAAMLGTESLGLVLTRLGAAALNHGAPPLRRVLKNGPRLRSG